MQRPFEMATATAKKPKKSKAPACRCNGAGCRNLVAVRVSGPRKGERYGAKCHKCRSRSWRKNNPYRAAYVRQKGHAKARGIEFRISFRHWKCFAEKSELIENSGLTADALTVDRRDNLKGYVIGNLQVMTRRANSEKRARHDAIREREGNRWRANY